MNSVYDRLPRVKTPARSYTFRFLFITFLGIHIPLISLIAFINLRPDMISPPGVIIITLLLALGTATATLALLNGLLSPLHSSKRALEAYLKDRTPASICYTMEATVRADKMRNKITSPDDLREEKNELIALLPDDLRPQKMQEILEHDDFGPFSLELKQVPVKSIIESSLKDIKPLAENKRIAILVSCPANASVNVDEKLISQVVKNLLSNAIKFSHKESAISVCVENISGMIHLNVSDSGLGFNPHDKQKIFQRTTPVGRKGSESEGAAGMGLYLSSKIVQAHKGALSAESEGPECGATFTLALLSAA